MSYKVKILNGVLKLKTFSDVVLNILGVKDLGTQTGEVTNGYIDWSMQQYTQTTAQWNASTYILLKGQVGIEDTGTTTFKLKVGDGVSTWQQLGYISGGGGNDFPEHLYLTVVNKTGDNLLATGYKVLKVQDAQGQRLTVNYALADSDANSADTIGVVYENIDNNQSGKIVVIGELTGLDTTGSLQGETWNDGDELYLSPFTAGSITNIKPTAPNHLVVLGYVVYSHTNNGKIYVKIDNGYEISELHDCYLPSPNNNDGIFWNTSNLRYENKSVESLLPNHLKAIVKTSDSSTITGTTSNILLDSLLIPENTFKVGLSKIIIRNKFAGTAGNKTTRLYINTSNSLAGATLIGTYTAGSGALSVDMARYAAIKSTNSFEVLNSSTTVINSEAQSSSAVSTITYDATIDNYLICAIQLGSASDSAINSFIYLEI
jgi:hypothetical protein